MCFPKLLLKVQQPSLKTIRFVRQAEIKGSARKMIILWGFSEYRCRADGWLFFSVTKIREFGALLK